MGHSYLDWRQDDVCLNRTEAWPAVLFPDATYHYFRDCGCLVCALAVMLRHYGAEAETNDALFNPWVLNQRLIACEAFDSAADLELNHIDRLYPLEYVGQMPYTRSALARIAKSGSPCLITVPGKKAKRHFTTLLHVLEDDAVLYDPVCGEARLGTYNRVCEIREFRFARGPVSYT